MNSFNIYLYCLELKRKVLNDWSVVCLNSTFDKHRYESRNLIELYYLNGTINTQFSLINIYNYLKYKTNYKNIQNRRFSINKVSSKSRYNEVSIYSLVYFDKVNNILKAIE